MVHGRREGICRYADMQICRYADMQMCGYADVEEFIVHGRREGCVESTVLSSQS